MPVTYRQMRFGLLTSAQQALKLAADAKYEADVHKISHPFYQKKRTIGVTAEEETTYKQDKAKLWDDYYNWAIANSLYDEVTVEQQLEEANASFALLVEQVNALRAELGLKSIKIIEVS